MQRHAHYTGTVGLNLDLTSSDICVCVLICCDHYLSVFFLFFFFYQMCKQEIIRNTHTHTLI